MDFKFAFLNGDLNEEVYIEQLDGFVISENQNCMQVKKDTL